MKITSIVSLLALAALSAPALAQPADKKVEPKQPESVPAKKIAPAATDGKKDEKKAEPTLKVGSAAPAITASNWVQGTEVKSFEKGKVYVVEFWATWCGPCIKNIPHLTELSKAHKDVTFIGMASSERPAKDAKEDNRLEVVKKFVKDQGDKMTYAVAYDADRKMSETWMKPAGQNGIPCAFIVNGEGKIAFIGHPATPEFQAEVEKLSKIKAEKKSDASSDKKSDHSSESKSDKKTNKKN